MRKLKLLLLMPVLLACEKQYDIEYLPKESGKVLLEDYWITDIKFVNESKAWIATFMQGLILYENGKTTFFNESNSEIPNSMFIRDIEIDTKGNVWLAANGLFKFDGKTLTAYPDINSALEQPVVRDIAISSDDRIWIASSTNQSGELAEVNDNGWNTFAPENDEFNPNFITSITIDENDNVWMAIFSTSDSVYLVKFSDGQWTKYGEKELGFAPYFVKEIDTDSENRVWGVIDYSLSSSIFVERPVLFSFDGETCSTYEPDENFSHFYFASALAVDSYDRVWVGSSRLLSIFEDDNWLANYLIPEDQTIFSIAHTAGNETWVGTSKGIIVFKTEEGITKE